MYLRSDTMTKLNIPRYELQDKDAGEGIRKLRRDVGTVFGLMDGSQKGRKLGGRGRNRTSTCRHIGREHQQIMDDMATNTRLFILGKKSKTAYLKRDDELHDKLFKVMKK